MEELKQKIETLMKKYQKCADITVNRMKSYHRGKADGLQLVVWELEKIIEEEKVGQEDAMSQGLPW